MNKKIGFIGSGNMARAMIHGILSSGFFSSEQMIASARSQETLAKINQEFGIETTLENTKVIEQSNIVVLAVKPYLYESILQENKGILADKIVISIAPGKPIVLFESILGEGAKILRTMPNTPAMVGEGMSAICPNKNITEEELELLQNIFATFGKVEQIEEKLFDAYVAVAGSSPAYVYMLIEAMGDAAVLGGMPRAQAYRFAAQSVLGAAKMVLESNLHPGVLKDQVCSPGGTTIEGVAVLEDRGFRSAIIEAMRLVQDKAGWM